MPKKFSVTVADSIFSEIAKNLNKLAIDQTKIYVDHSYIRTRIIENIDNIKRLIIRMIKDLPIAHDIYKINHNDDIYSVQIPVSFINNIDIYNDEHREYLLEWWNTINKYLMIGVPNNKGRQAITALELFECCIIPIILPKSLIKEKIIDDSYALSISFENNDIKISYFENAVESKTKNDSKELSKSYVDTISHVSRIESDMTDTLLDRISSFSDYAASIANNQYNAAYVIDMFMRSVIGLDFCQEGSLETPPLQGSNGMNPIDLGYGICNTFQSLMLKQAAQFGMSDDEIKNNATELVTLARDLVMSIISDMYTVSKEMVSIQNSIIWFYRIDDVEFDKSMNTGRFVKFEYKKSNNQILISAKPFSIQL